MVWALLTVPPALRGAIVTSSLILSDTQLVVVFFIVSVKESELPAAGPLKVTVMGLFKSPSVMPVISSPEIEYLLGDCTGLV